MCSCTVFRYFFVLIIIIVIPIYYTLTSWWFHFISVKKNATKINLSLGVYIVWESMKSFSEGPFEELFVD